MREALCSSPFLCVAKATFSLSFLNNGAPGGGAVLRGECSLLLPATTHERFLWDAPRGRTIGESAIWLSPSLPLRR